MFQPLAAQVGLHRLFRYRPSDLAEYLERYWDTCGGVGFLGTLVQGGLPPAQTVEEFRSRARAYRTDVRNPAVAPPAPLDPVAFDPGVLPALGPADLLVPPVPAIHAWPWRHLAYSFALENTRIVEIFRRVVDELAHGERLGRPDWDVQRWARNTEELFFSDRCGFGILSPHSAVRPDGGAIRRNAYYRLLGIDLSHGLDDGRPYPFRKPEIANRDFSRVFEQLLRDVWRGYTNRNNMVGSNTTDPSGIADLCSRLHQMLQDRRLSGALAREEFYAAAVLSWFHMTVWGNTAVLRFLEAEGADPSERLRLVGQRVGLAAHSRSYNYMRMAIPLSNILWRIEAGWFDLQVNAAMLYMGGVITNWMIEIINNWSAATGRNLKEFVGDGAPASRRVTIAGVPA